MSALYRKYRPHTFQDVVGQEMIVQTLSNALVHNIPAHSYLFTGPRGTGKTSLARIFAKALNCQNRTGAVACGKCPHCQAVEENQSLDILEIDAASYTGVDNIRSLRETMNNAPLLGKHKIYIIDEVHMLSIGAFNALLKVMEEPPTHVVFLLATTELQKVPKTILSRCQRFDLRKLTLTEIVTKLERICKQEKIKAEKEALVLIAKNSGGALRDAESLLTQMSTLSGGSITTVLVQDALGVSDAALLSNIIRFYWEGNLAAVLLALKEVEASGKNPTPFTQDIISLFRNILLYKAHQKFDIDPLILLSQEEQNFVSEAAQILNYAQLSTFLEALEDALIKIRNTSFGFLPLEIAFVKNMPEPSSSSDSNTLPPTPPTEKAEASKEAPAPRVVPPIVEKSESVIEKKTPVSLEATVTQKPTTPHTNVNLVTVQENWRHITDKVKLLNASLSVALQSAKPVSVNATGLVLSVKYKFHQERLNEPANRLTLQEAFDTILGTHLAISIVLESANVVKEIPQEADSMVQHALDLLGGKVLSTE